jgi:hypothetical protein
MSKLMGFSVTLGGLHPGSEQGISHPPCGGAGPGVCGLMDRFGTSLLWPGERDHFTGSAVWGVLTDARTGNPVWTSSTDSIYKIMVRKTNDTVRSAFLPPLKRWVSGLGAKV